jgi:hypothetical protein
MLANGIKAIKIVVINSGKKPSILTVPVVAF